MSDPLKKIQSEVDAMNKSFGETFASEAPDTEVPPTNAPSTEAPTTDAPVETDAPATTAPETKAPATSPPSTEPPMDEKDKIIADLRKQIEDKKGPIPTKAPATEPPFKVEEQDFVGDIDPTDLTKDDLNKLLNKVFSSGVELATKTVKTTLPNTIETTVAIREHMQKLNNDFYAENEDLRSFQKVVGIVFGELSAANPKKPIIEILKDTGLEVRKRLSLPPQKKKEEKDDRKGGPPPKLPGKRGSSGKPGDENKLTGLEAELSEMTKVLGR